MAAVTKGATELSSFAIFGAFRFWWWHATQSTAERALLGANFGKEDIEVQWPHRERYGAISSVYGRLKFSSKVQ
jgi:hypothetical protein